MFIMDAKVEWHKGFSNSPDLKILVDKMPDNDSFRFQEKNCIYYAENEGLVRFYYYRRPGEGFGGREFKLTMEDGSEKVLKGPWSSNSGAVNSIGFGPCQEISITDDERVWKRSYTSFASAVTLDLYKQAAALAGVHLVKWGGYLVPSLCIDRVVKYSHSYGNKDDEFLLEYVRSSNGDEGWSTMKLSPEEAEEILS